MDRLSGVINSVALIASGENVMEPLMVQSPSSAGDCMAHGGFELQQTTVLPAGMTVRATNPQLQQQKLLWQQQQQLLRQQQLLQQQYVQQQYLQNALLQAMQQVQNQSTANRSFSSSPVVSPPSLVPTSSSAFVAIQISATDQTIQSRPVSMVTAAAAALPITTSPAVQPSMVQLGGVRMVPEPSMVQLGGVRMVPVAPFVTNQLRSPQPTSAMLMSRPQQQPLIQRPFVIGQTASAQSQPANVSASAVNNTQRPVLVSTPSQATATPPAMTGMQSYPLSQLAQVQQLSTRFVGLHNATASAHEMAYVSPVLPSLATTISPGAFQVPSDMSSVLTDTLKLSPSLVGGPFLTHTPSFESAAGPMQELSLTADGRIVNFVGRPVPPETYMQSLPSIVTAHADTLMSSFQPDLPNTVNVSSCLSVTPVSSLLPLTAPPAVNPVQPTTSALKLNVTAIADETFHRNPSDKPITVISSEPDKPDSCILTHIIEGFVIREGPVPFPVHKSFLNELPVSDEDDDMGNESQTSDFDSSDPDDSNVSNKVATPKSDKVAISETPCEYCGKTGFEVRFGRPHRFCSLACSSKQHVALKKPGIRQMSSDFRDSSTAHHKSLEDLVGSNEVVLLQPDIDHVTLATRDRDPHPAPCHPLDTSAATTQSPLVQRSPVYHRHESPTKSLTTNSGYRYQQPVQPSPHGSLGSSEAHLSDWGVQEVCEFVRSLPDCSMYADDFRRQEIDGQALMLLTEEHLMTSLNMKLGPALKICQRIRALKDL